MKKLFLLLMAVLSIGLMASAQTRTVTGTVIEGATEEPMLGVSVLPFGQTRGVVTDLDGHYSITVPANVTKLTFSYVGMDPITLDIPANNKLDVRMESKNNVLDEVMVVAYGTTPRSAYTGSAAKLDAAQLEDAVTSNVTNAFAGKMAGVQTLSSNGQPGTTAQVLIRGVGSINAGTSPLWVVDGMPYDGDIANIPNSDIESVTVLKDAASTALYGARGANGVIIVTTKKGSSGPAKVSADIRIGVNSRAVPQYDIITDQRQFFETTYQAMDMTNRYFKYADKNITPEQSSQYINQSFWKQLGGYQTWTIPEGQYIFNSEGKFNPNATPGWTDGRYYFLADDWEKESLINGMRQEYVLSVTGGNDRMQYYLSGSYIEDEGIIKNSHYNRLFTTANVDYQAKSWLKVGTTLSYTYVNNAYPDDQTSSGSSGNVFYLLQVMGPIFPMYVRNADGSIMYNEQFNNPVYDYGDGADYGNGRINFSRPVMALSNPTGQLLYNVSDYLMDIFDGKWYARINPIQDLTVTGTATYHVDNTRQHQVLNGVYGQFKSIGGQAIQAQTRERSIQTQLMAQYTHTFGENHNFDLLGAYETVDYQVETVWGQKSNLYNPRNFVISNAIDEPHAGGSQSSMAYRAFIGKFNYNYANKYFFMASMRHEASSRFAPDHRWGTFWSASAAWDLKKENFMRDLTWVDLLKYKISFGQNGNDAISGVGGISYMDFYDISGSSNGVFADATLAYKGNHDITWEKSNSFNTGFDFSLWSTKLQGTIEYYSRQTSDMLFNVPVSPSLGYGSFPSNVGSMRNYGFEFDFSYTIFKNRNIIWDVNANITLPKNKIIKLDPRFLDEDGYWWLSAVQFRKEGESMYQLSLPQYVGVDESNGEALYLAVRNVTDDAGNPIEIGKDENGEPIYQEEEYYTPVYNDARNTGKKETGDLMPKAYGGFGTSVKAYGFDFSASFAYQLGGRIIDYGYQNLMQPGSSVGNNWHKDILNAWTPDNTKTDVPRLYTQAEYPYANALSDRFLISSNYLSLTNVTIGYTLPKSLTKKISLSNVRVYCAAENVALWSKRKGLDPRQSFMSSNNSVYSPIRSVTGGLKVEF